MTGLADQISQGRLADRVFNEHQLGEMLGGGDARRYGLVNRALKDGSLIRLKRGLYMLDKRYRSEAIHPFAVAQALLPGSYVSLETALAYHGWIPEAVYTTASVSPGRKSVVQQSPELGQFSFHPLAICDYRFLVAVSRTKFGALTAFIAEPLRALMDLVAFRKAQWSGIEWLTGGMRIEYDVLLSLRKKDFAALRGVYKHKMAIEFLAQLETTILSDKAAKKGHDIG